MCYLRDSCGGEILRFEHSHRIIDFSNISERVWMCHSVSVGSLSLVYFENMEKQGLVGFEDEFARYRKLNVPVRCMVSV